MTQKSQAASNRGPSVFIVDDDPNVRNAISLLVTSAGLKATLFASAVDFLSQFNAESSGCLILDMNMPEMSGIELQKVLKERGILIPIIFVTASDNSLEAAEALRAGALDYILKPFNAQILLERIHEAIAIDSKTRNSPESS